MRPVAKVPTPQVEIGGLEDPAEEAAEIEAGYIWRQTLWSAMRMFVAGYRAGTLQGQDAVAAALDRRWGPLGRPVSSSVLGAALKDSERNNFRAEWLDWFACRSAEIADILARRVKPAKTAEQYSRDLEDEIRETLPKHADGIIRRARAR